MKVGDAIAEILKREGVDTLFGYPVNRMFECAAAAKIRPITVRQERIGVHMADAVARVTSGKKIGVFAMQHGPGTENTLGAIAQCYSESVPVLILPGGYDRRLAHVDPNFSAPKGMQHITKSVEQLTSGSDINAVFRRAFTQLRNGRGGPCVVEIPKDVWDENVPENFDYKPVIATRYGPDPAAVTQAAELLANAKRPVLYVGQGVHYAQAWPQVRQLAELLAAPVCTSLEGKSAFPENHPLALGSGGAAVPRAVREFLDNADVIFGIGCSFGETAFGVAMPKGKTFIHATLDPKHLNKDVEVVCGLIGDAALSLNALLEELADRVRTPRDQKATATAIAAVRDPWLAQWRAKLTSNETPITPYRVINDLMNTVDVANTIITHDAGSPRDQLSPFWVSTTPLSYLGWGKTTQLGYGLGLAMGAKIVAPDKLCINVWGDAAIGFTGMDFETAARYKIPILSILFNNFSMACELDIMPVSTRDYRATDISGHYADFARALGGHGERITDPAQIIPAIKRGIEKTKEGTPVLLEFITSLETSVSRYPLKATDQRY
ncbi:MAG TPA: thiamine pyrophosphate-requiring protein [Beijerinckiaceae bacterium]|jgi:acetolactate synthase-1/2/3 large subunit|nr:thiamine pyrophosphate-requiring protein [Beijerinckiaceae bacterium]